jgi:uncharacterized membrane protein
MFPPLPTDWSGLHPLIIHFPIALLFVAPLLVLIGVALKSGRRAYLFSALVLMVVGTIATFVAVSTGEAAGELAEGVGSVEAMLESHEDLAETTRAVFTVLTLLFAGILVVPALMKRELQGALFYIAHGVFLVAYVAGMAQLANTAHEGGRLVHQAGVRAMVASTATASAQPAPATPAREAEHDDDD